MEMNGEDRVIAAPGGVPVTPPVNRATGECGRGAVESEAQGVR